MIASNIIYDIINVFFIVYTLVLFATYILMGILSSFELASYVKKNENFGYYNIKSYKIIPSVSIIAPAYNEGKSIVENIRSLLSLDYPKLDVIIVNDGSTDDSLQKIIDHYNLVPVNLSIKETIKTAKIRGIYKSQNLAYSNLIIIDKENGGKSDALNAGINISRSDLFLGIDVDCIIRSDAILRMVKPFLEENDTEVIASGGVIRIANSCNIKNGKIEKINFPKKFWAKFQVLEYFRSFTLGRMAWSKVNGLLIISGAFGMFNREIVLEVGGYDTKTVGEDLELVVRIRKHMHKVRKQKYKVAFIPDPLCWTEVPETYKDLSKQRNRWTRGAIQTIIKHRDMFFNPKYGLIGMVSFPYWVFFEWLAPIVEAVGLVIFIYLILFSTINIKVFLILLLFVFAVSLAFSLFAVFYESYIFNKYRGFKFLMQVTLIAIAEMLIYHPLITVFSILGNIDYFIRKKRKWGKLEKKGFNSKK